MICILGQIQCKEEREWKHPEIVNIHHGWNTWQAGLQEEMFLWNWQSHWACEGEGSDFYVSIVDFVICFCYFLSLLECITANQKIEMGNLATFDDYLDLPQFYLGFLKTSCPRNGLKQEKQWKFSGMELREAMAVMSINVMKRGLLWLL